MKRFNIVDRLNKIFNLDPSLSGEEYLSEVALKISLSYDIPHFVLGLQGAEGKMNTLVTIINKNKVNSFCYELKDTPCENVFKTGETTIYRQHLTELFPKDYMIREMGIEAYIGAPIFDLNKNIVGVCCILNPKPFDFEDIISSILEFYAARATIELIKTSARDRNVTQYQEHFDFKKAA